MYDQVVVLEEARSRKNLYVKKPCTINAVQTVISAVKGYGQYESCDRMSKANFFCKVRLQT